MSFIVAYNASLAWLAVLVADTPAWVLWCLCLLLALCAWCTMRGYAACAGCAVLVVGGLSVAYSGVFAAPIAWLAALGVAPVACWAALALVGLLTGHLMGLLGGRKDDFVFRKSQWLGSLLLWLCMFYLLAFTVGASLVYDASGDRMMAELRNPAYVLAHRAPLSTELQLLDDGSLKADELHAAAELKDIPAAAADNVLQTDNTYQLAPPGLILQGTPALKPAAFAAARVEDKSELQKLPPLITNLENRHYIQDNSIRIRKILVPLLKEIAGGADINTLKTNEKKTALHYACAIGDCDITAWLLNNNASQTIRDASGKTPRECVGANHSDEIRRMLDKAAKK